MSTESHYIKLYHGKDWCIASVKLPSESAVLEYVLSVTRWDVRGHRLGFSNYLEHDLRHFATFEIGAFKIEVGSRDIIRYSDFFKKGITSRLANVYHL